MSSSRVLTGLTLSAATAALTLGLAAAPASAAAALSASKTTGLAKVGESITVKGSGFEAGKSYMLLNCNLATQRGEGCDMGGAGSVTADGAGAFSAAFTAKGQYGSTDCDKVECGVVVYDMSTHSLTARVKLSFGAAPATGKPATTKPAESAKPTASTSKPASKPATTAASAKPSTSAPGAAAATPSTKPELAKTGGSDVIPMLAAGGAALVLVGTGATVAVRRRGGANHAA